MKSEKAYNNVVREVGLHEQCVQLLFFVHKELTIVCTSYSAEFLEKLAALLCHTGTDIFSCLVWSDQL